MDLKSLTLKQLSELTGKFYRAVQIYRWIWQKGEEDIMKFSDISKDLRKFLVESGYYVSHLEVKNYITSNDGSIKFLFDDGFEAVYMPESYGNVVCVSSQIGCSLHCQFCATGLMGFKRNLAFWEIADQVLQISKIVKKKITNVVFMGMGEPLLNLKNVKQAIRIMTSHIGLNIGSRHITVSTSGVIPKIYELAHFNRRIKLAISLHSAIDEKRKRIMPIAKPYSLSDLKDALLYYYQIKRRRITIEYIQLAGFNDNDEDIAALKKFLEGLNCKINIIPYNPVPHFSWRSPSFEEVYDFHRKLKQVLNNITITIRWSKARDILGACGQLGLKL